MSFRGFSCRINNCENSYYPFVRIFIWGSKLRCDNVIFFDNICCHRNTMFQEILITILCKPFHIKLFFNGYILGLTLIVIFVGLRSCYHRNCVKKPTLYFIDNEVNTRILNMCKHIHTKYYPTFWMVNLS